MKRIPYAEIAYALLLVGWIAMILWMVSLTGCTPARTPIVLEPERVECLHGPGTVETLPGTRLVITTVPVSLPDEPECVPYDMDDDQDVDLRDWAVWLTR